MPRGNAKAQAKSHPRDDFSGRERAAVLHVRSSDWNVRRGSGAPAGQYGKKSSLRTGLRKGGGTGGGPQALHGQHKDGHHGDQPTDRR
jgi:hypothetical protein